MITRYFAQAKNEDYEFELLEVRSLADAVTRLKECHLAPNSYLVMERRYEMKSERSVTVNTGE
jgi:hypothetical protein